MYFMLMNKRAFVVKHELIISSLQKSYIGFPNGLLSFHLWSPLGDELELANANFQRGRGSI